MTNGEWIRGVAFKAMLYRLSKRCPPYVVSCKTLDCDECWQKWQEEEFVSFEKLPIEQQEAWDLRDFFIQVEQYVEEAYIDCDTERLQTRIRFLCESMERELLRLRRMKFKDEKGEKIDE